MGRQTVTLRARNAAGAERSRNFAVTVADGCTSFVQFVGIKLHVSAGSSSSAILGGTQYLAVEYNSSDATTASTHWLYDQNENPGSHPVPCLTIPRWEIVGYAYGGDRQPRPKPRSSTVVRRRF